MPPEGGTRRSLTASYSWGQQGLEAQFAPVFQPGQGIFSPGYPLAPPEPERLRLWDFPVGVNTIYTPRAYEPVSFAELRALADAHDITRLAIETRKDQLEKLEWNIKPRSLTRPRVETLARAARVAEFWRRPDGERPFATWLRELLEDVLVIDAPALELRRNRGGDLVGLDVVDGATIKLLFDETGRRPLPPAPAFEQVIHGRPWKLLTSDDLLYLPRNPRPGRAYGFGPVEQIVMTVNIGLRRQAMQLQHFTEGNVPPGLLNAPDGWNVEQIRQFQEWFDSVLAGNTGSRTRLVWGPAGTTYQPFKEAPYKDEFDEWLARIVCYAFSLPATAFTRQVNRATAETAQGAALAEGLAPLMGWVKRLCDHVIQDRLGHPDLEWAWAHDRALDPAEQAKLLDLYVRSGIYTVNEARAALGLDPVPGGDAARIYSTAGATPLAAPGDDTATKHAATLRKDFNPNEPRVPAGDPDGGQWTGEGGGDSPGATPRPRAGSGPERAPDPSGAGHPAMLLGPNAPADPEPEMRDFDAHIVEAGAALSPEMWRTARELYRLFRDHAGDLGALYQYLRDRNLSLTDLPNVLRSLFDAPKPLSQLQTSLPSRGFDTDAQLRAYLGPPPPGYEWHHLIEQNGQWRSDLTSPEGIRTWIQNTDNMVLVPMIKHYCISGLMSSSLGDGVRLRDVVRAHAPEAQREIAVRLLYRCGVIK